ncbi:protein serine/threonine phosphatase [Aureococcus anophagefferens]|nr:protein serine/threonine phosphatase [Aureococcus anophagefferens]
MGAAVSARADEVPGQQEKLAALYESLGVASLSEERRVEFEGQLRELYERHGGDQLFLEEDARKRSALFKLFEKEARELFAEPSLAGASEFRQKRLSYSAAPQRGKSDASSATRASGERNRRPSSSSAARARNAVTVKPGYEATTAPFDGSILGTYSYHGIEPKHYGAGVVSKINQDRGCVVAPYNDSDACSLYCIFDGHGEHGDGVSEFVLATIVQDLEAHPDLHAAPDVALKATFLATDMELARSNVESYYSGTTAVVCYRVDDTIFTANAGDSRAIVAVKDGAGRTCVPLSIDHNPNAPGERERIVKAGGFVSDPPEEGLSARVWLDRKCTQVGLAMGRSIGDNAVKRIGVIAEPEVRTHEVSDRDDFLVMATDGVWEFIPNEEAIELVGQFFDSGAENAAKDACKSLIDLAVKRWRDIEGDYRDDITAIVMKLATQDPDAAL